jgi:hypothetical protein
MDEQNRSRANVQTGSDDLGGQDAACGFPAVMLNSKNVQVRIQIKRDPAIIRAIADPGRQKVKNLLAAPHYRSP